VLIVTDQPLVGLGVQAALASPQGARAQVAHPALVGQCCGAFDLVLLDLEARGAAKHAAQLRRLHAESPLVLLAARPDSTVAARLGAQACLSKTLRMAELSRALQALVERQRGQRERAA